MKSFGTIGVILAAVALVSPTTAEAQTKEQKAGARAAAEAGGDAFDAGKYAEAADLFERAERLIHAPPHLLYGARANVKLGRLVEARELYLGLTREKLASSAPRAFRDAQQMGEKELADVEARLPYISVVVQGGPVQMPVKVTRNGEPVPPELVGIPTPANPGEYSYQAFAEGMESTATSIKLKEGARETVVLTLHEIPGYLKPSATEGPTSAPPKNSGGGSLSSPELSDSGNARGRPYLYASIASFGLAVVGGVVGPVFLLKSARTKEPADELFASCNATGSCSATQAAEIKSIDSRATMQQGIGIGGLVAAGLGIAGGITFLVMDQSRSVATGPHVTPFVGLNRVGVLGTF